MAGLAKETDMRVIMPITNKWDIIRKDLVKNRYIYIMLLPVVTYYIVFHYVPLYGAQIAFRDFSPSRGIWGSRWVGFKYFEEFFNSYYFGRLLRNTVLISLYDLIFGFPAPIILALLLNEVKNNIFKRTVQTVTYLPHFISLVVICGMIIDFLARDGLVNNMLNRFGIESIPFMIKPEWFRTVYVASNIWQGIGWGSIIYLAALSNIDPQLYEAATIDGAGRFRQALHVTLPGILPTIVIMLILRLGQMLNVGSEKILLLYNTSTYETADVISTFVYRKGILEASYSYSTAVGLFNSVINFALLVTANFISRKATETSLW
ncbi:ABC transporter permease [Mahella australiensis]|uniref:Carbohydrate ABC transporter membrane protein 1, CUT1 family n=1 Tax=Mahella australiensis (strain DSM 15567 / CIP 107919 / 50-1 BON) TaxID=697281 RepID=F3ZVY8_MAHA5|nr:ABC transporter permease subunit [Mahella australiensis]AEE95362.1 carbohydrate ABC transporter membrane protein 1, CUT1 family [Mahella australiensis 50-1 BON]